MTVARDLGGVMKVAHKLQSRIQQHFGAVVEVFMEHVKHEWWVKLHEATSEMGLSKGNEVQAYQVTHIPDGIRVHPYKRDHLPSLEVLLLWDDPSGATKGRCLFTAAHPTIPTLEQCDDIFADIEPYFAMRWLHLDLRMAPPVRGEFDLIDAAEGTGEKPQHDTHVGGGVDVTVLACHAYGFAREKSEGVVRVSDCQPIAFRGVSNDAGLVKVCFLPAEINKIQVAETERFYGTDILLPGSKITPLDEGPTRVPVELVPKALAEVIIHVFALPDKLPPADDTDGVIDWASEDLSSPGLEALPDAIVEASPLKDGTQAAGARVSLRHVDRGAFLASDGGLPEGCVSFSIRCSGYEPEERTLMLLVGANEFYVPLRKAA
eukprot:gnl/TRDRNA2_/TRDRNA2_36631_c0_seq1.p1 gnl/TRDRNA2_/TRDRNA2_36631_c0~~gnl/TRDRNA2_/TRDRNA2_36631_c0_seq1.p1  ORF type:complete len:430 (-),score=73.92 gnl/TRDRNA2_/TRDRNA2_36631_c0_seq1:112-1242(-)